MHLRIGTRKSPLALAQAEEVRARLIAAWPGLEVELAPMTTSGDRFTGSSLADAGGKGLFTKEIEEALLARAIDLAVHSMKDMPADLPEGLTIGAMLEREDARDRLIGAESLEALAPGARLGTSSPRRAAQALMRRPDLAIVPLRGNVGTRLAKVARGEVAATMLAAAGLKRLGLHPDGKVLGIDECLPAVAQGAIGIECRLGEMQEWLAPLSHQPTEIAVGCERAFLKHLGGSCRAPIAGYAEIQKEKIAFRGFIAQPDGTQPRSVEMEGTVAEAEALGIAAAGRLRR